ncbi:MAG: DUF1579 family protein [Acidimicrobiales bacterium]|jgi:hypothetical protein
MDDNDRTPLLQRLEPFVGRWTMEALFPGVEPTGPTGRTTFEWMLGGQFLLQRTEVSEPGAPEAVMIVGLDPEGAAFTQHYFDSRGVARLYSMNVEERIWTLQRDTPDFTSLPFRQRFVGHFSEDGGRIDGRWERSQDGASWEHDFELIYERIT